MSNISKVIVFFLAVFYISFSVTSLASDILDIKAGKYVYSEQGEELIDGKKASITWVFNINEKSEVIVGISSWHAPFTCNGKYKITKVNNELNLIWMENDNIGIDCDTPPPQFSIKQGSNGSLLIKSELFPWAEVEWNKLKKIHR